MGRWPLRLRTSRRTFEPGFSPAIAMLTIYLLAVAFGGTLLGASLLLGGKGGDHPALGDGGGDADGVGGHDAGGHDHVHDHHDGDMDVDGLLAWLPLKSVRFWSFFMAFGGAIGCALTVGGVISSAVLVAVLALVVGWATGLGAVTAVRLAGARSADSMTRPGELIGTTGILLLGAGAQSPGKIRIEVKGRVQDFIVETDDQDPLSTGTKVLVIGSTSGGRLTVTKLDD